MYGNLQLETALPCNWGYKPPTNRDELLIGFEPSELLSSKNGDLKKRFELKNQKLRHRTTMSLEERG